MLRPGLLLVAVALAACGGGTPATTDGPTTIPPVETPATSTTNDATTTGPPSTTTAPVEPNLIEIQVSGSTVVGGGKVALPLGEEVTIRVESDIADEAHLHGYDLFLDLEPNVAAELVFVASIPGVFELELEGSGLLLAEIEVS